MMLKMILMMTGALAVSGSLHAEDIASADPIFVGTQREIFVDRYLIDTLRDVHLRLHEPRSAGAALVYDRPWEGAHAAYVTILEDAGKYRMYYRGAPLMGPDGNDGELTCYAESADGIAWTRPNLGLFEIMGTRENNVILAHTPPDSHNFVPFIDTRPGVPFSERYKAVAGVDNKTGLLGFVSEDGIHWRRIQEEPVFTTTDRAFDSQNVIYWSEREQCYVLYYRMFHNDIRLVARATSEDFINWSPGQLMAYSAAEPTIAEQLYTNQTLPYFRAPHVNLALAARFMPGRKALTPEQLAKIGVEPGSWSGDDTSDTVLMSTRGNNIYDREFPQALVTPGDDHRNWVSRCNYAALGIVQTSPNEMSIYVQRHHGLSSHYLERLTFRLDGFSSLSAGHATGEMLTKPFTFNGSQLELNFETSAAGFIRVEIQNADGSQIEGFTLADSPELLGNDIAANVKWASGKSIADLAGRPVRLRFVLKEADLYSLKFNE